MNNRLFQPKGYLHAKFIGLVILSISMMALNHAQMHLKTVRAFLVLLTSPAQYIIEWPAKMLQDISATLASNTTLSAENEKLQTQNLLLNTRLQKLILLEQENNQLRKFLHTPVATSNKVLVAQLLSIDPDPFAQQVMINKGIKQKLYLGQPVLDEYGVFGQVIELGTFSSRVMLITDARSAVPVQDRRTGIRGIVIGLGNTTVLQLVDMPATAKIKVGDALVTSGLGGIFPVGYPVGVIATIQENPGNQFAQVTVRPAAHLDQGHLVLLIWPEFEKIIEEQKQLAGTNTDQVIKNEGSKNVH